MADNITSEKVVGAHTEHNEPIDQAHYESGTPHHMTVGEYGATRFSTLKPPMHKAPNPFKLLAMLNGRQWLFFLVGFFAWVSSSTLK
jgi:SHS family lactate transporter-like MFS transporter